MNCFNEDNNLIGNNSKGNLVYAKLIRKILDYRKGKNLSLEEFSKRVDLPLSILTGIENMNVLNIGLFSIIFEKIGLNLYFEAVLKNIEGEI